LDNGHRYYDLLRFNAVRESLAADGRKFGDEQFLFAGNQSFEA
jgi:hypothetical protein